MRKVRNLVNKIKKERIKKMRKGLVVLVIAIFGSLIVSASALAVPTIFDGQTVYGSIDTRGEIDYYYFLGNAGDITDIFMFRTDNTSSNWGTLDSVVELWYGGARIAYDDDSGGDSPVPGPCANALINDYSLPNTGEYAIYARSYIYTFPSGVEWGVTTGTYGLTLTGSGHQEIIPEPATMVLFGIGSAAMAFARRKKKLA